MKKKSTSYMQKSAQTEKLFKETLFFFTGDENASNVYTTLSFFGIFAAFIDALNTAAEVEEARQRLVSEELRVQKSTCEDPMAQIIAQLKAGQKTA